MIAASERYLQPLYQQMKEDLLRRQILHTDETEVEVLWEMGRKAEQKSRMWLYRTSACDSDRPIVLFDYRDSIESPPCISNLDIPNMLK